MTPGTQGGGGGVGGTEHEQQEWAHPPPSQRQNDPMITISNEMSNGSHSQGKGKVNGKEALNVILNFKVIIIQISFSRL